MKNYYSIGQMAQLSDCKVQTIRYYEHINILPAARRNSGNQRIYHKEQLDRLKFIRHSRDLGFSLDHIREILLLADNPAQSCQQVDQITQNHLQEVELKIKKLQGLQKELKRMISQCRGYKIEDCRIIEALSD